LPIKEKGEVLKEKEIQIPIMKNWDDKFYFKLTEINCEEVNSKEYFIAPAVQKF
jgi:hypothetical protein